MDQAHTSPMGRILHWVESQEEAYLLRPSQAEAGTKGTSLVGLGDPCSCPVILDFNLNQEPKSQTPAHCSFWANNMSRRWAYAEIFGPKSNASFFESGKEFTFLETWDFSGEDLKWKPGLLPKDKGMNEKMREFMPKVRMVCEWAEPGRA